MTKYTFHTTLALCLCALAAHGQPARPNLLLMVADDLGYNDLGCYGAARIKTPHIDRLSAEGVRFADAHSTCAVCNPSRYAILSGTYLLHAKRKNDYSLYFHDGQVTLASLLKAAGFRTAALGKWHNGFGRNGDPDYNRELKPGPLEMGFDTFFGTPRTHNEPPLVFVDGHAIVGYDPADPIRIDKSKGAHGVMSGGSKAQAARPDERIDLIVAEKAAAFLAQQSRDKPFFLYLAWAAPHTPVNPAPEFRGSSGAGLYGDFIQQLDHCVGLVLNALEKQGLAQNTLVLFTSDNGAVLTRDALDAGHRANGSLLGQKTDAWEGGHRVPLIARWPGHIPAATLRKALFTQVDLMATCAEAVGVALPAGASPDGISDWPAFLDPVNAPAKRTEAVFQGTGGHVLREGDWVYCPKQGSCGMTVQAPPGPQWGLPYAKLGLVNSDVDAQGRVKLGAPAAQLYHLKDDPGQALNVIGRHPAVAQRLAARLDALVPPKRPTPKKTQAP